MKKISPIRSLLLLALLLGGVACSSGSKEQKPDPVQLLLVEAQSLARLELATTKLRTTVVIDPKQDGFLGWKRLFGTRRTELELTSQASVSCDLSKLTESMIHSVNDTLVELTLPPLEVQRELEGVHRKVRREADPLRSSLTANEVNELLRQRKELIEETQERALMEARPQLFRAAERSARTRLAPLFAKLGLGMHVSLAPQDAAYLAPSGETNPQ